MKNIYFALLAVVLVVNLQAVFHKIADYCAMEDIGPVEMTGNIAYLSNSEELHILDISNPASPVCLAILDAWPNVTAMHAVGNLLYTSTTSQLQIYDISEPLNPVLLGSCPSYGEDFCVGSGLVFFPWNYSDPYEQFSGVNIYDVSNPASPIQIYNLNLTYWVNAVYATGNILYLGDDMGLRIYDVSVPLTPVLLGFYHIQYGVYNIFVTDGLAYLSAQGLRILDVSNPAAPIFLSSIPALNVLSIKKNGSTLYLGTENGLQAVNVSDPHNPVAAGFYQQGYFVIAGVIGNTCITYHSQRGLTFIDVSTEQSHSLLGSLDTPGNASTLLVENGTAYILDGSNGLLIADLDNPTNPIVLGSCPTDKVMNDFVKAGNLVYIACGNWDSWGGLQIFDVSNFEPVLVGSLALQDYSEDIELSGTTAYLTDNFYGLKIVNIADPAQPVLLGTFSTPGYAKSVAVSGNYAYLTTSGSLNIIDVSNPQQPHQLGSLYLGSPSSIALAGNVAYITDYTLGLVVVDLNDPNNPFIISCLNPRVTSALNRCQIQGNRLFVLDAFWNEINVYDITNAPTPIPSSRYSWNLLSTAVFREGNILYTANGHLRGICIHDFSVVDNDEPIAPPVSKLTLANYPNPFNPSTAIRFTIPKPGKASLQVYNLRGQLVNKLLEHEFTIGQHEFVWDGKDKSGKVVASGLYLIRLTQEQASIVHKIMMLN